MTRTIISILFSTLFLTLFSCSPEKHFTPEDGDEDVGTDTTPDTTDPFVDIDAVDMDIQQDMDVVTDDATDVITDDAGEPPLCAPGTGDCNGDPSDGCETDLTSDAENCGTCGHDCLGTNCVASLCEAVTVATPIGTSSGLHNGYLALSATHVYFGYWAAPVGGVSMVAKDGTGATCIECNVGEPRELATDASYVYWVDIRLNEVRRAPLSGSPVSTLWTGAVGWPIALDPTHVYWFASSTNSIMQADLDGSNAVAVASGQPNVRSIAVDAGFAFWTTTNALVTLDLSSGTTTTLASGLSEPRGVAVDATHVYWVEGTWTAAQTIQRIPRTGGTIEPLSSGDAVDITLDATDIYVADGRGSTIWRMPKTGGTPQILASGGPANHPWDIAVDATHVFWSNEGDGAVGKVAK